MVLTELYKLASYFRAFRATFECVKGGGGVGEHENGGGVVLFDLGSEGQTQGHGSKFSKE